MQAEREKAEDERIAAKLAAEQAKRDLELAEQRRVAQENQAGSGCIAAEKRAESKQRQHEIDDRSGSHALKDERLKREAGHKSTKAAINRQALADLIEHADITEEQAKLVIKC